MAKLTTPIPQNKIEESFVWRDWFQKLSDKVYGTMAAQDANNVNITGGTIHPSLTGVTKIIPGTNVTISPAEGVGEVTINAVGGGGSSTSAPVTYTNNFTLTAPTNWVINNKSSSFCVATLPSASSYVGSTITFQNYQDKSLISASNNIVQLGGSRPINSILNGFSGSWATLVSNGTSWVILQQSPNAGIFLENEGVCAISSSGILETLHGYLITESGTRLVLS
jgi:hypothetical protein